MQVIETLEEANFTISNYNLATMEARLRDKDTERIEVWHLHDEECGAPACYTIEIVLEWKKYYAEFGYTPN